MAIFSFSPAEKVVPPYPFVPPLNWLSLSYPPPISQYDWIGSLPLRQKVKCRNEDAVGRRAGGRVGCAVDDDGWSKLNK
jgi:hypothetical protein